MKNVKILRLTLENFKGQRHLELALDGRSAVVYGDNGTGKTTINDAWTWLLFGKDSHGDAKFDLKPHGADRAVLDNRAITSVEAELDVDGEALTLRRTYAEKWSSRRGSGEVFDGHTSDFFVDGVPVKKYAFEEAVAGLCDESLFRTLTNVTWFCGGMNWRDRRAVLFDLGNIREDRALLAEREEFTPLLEAMGRLNLDEFRKKLQAERKGLIGVRDDVPARMDECRKIALDLREIDFPALERERAALAARQNEVRADLTRLDHGALLERRRNERTAAMEALRTLERENREHRQSQVNGDVDRLSWELEHRKAALQNMERRMEGQKQEAAGLEETLERMRRRWREINARTLDGAACPTCGRPLEGELLKKAEETFRADKQRDLDNLVKDSEVNKARLENLRLCLAQDTDRLSQERAELNKLQEALEEARRAVTKVDDLPDYRERRDALEAEVRRLDGEIKATEEDGAGARAELERSDRELTEKIRSLDGQLAMRDVLAEADRRIEDLRRQGLETEARLERLDRLADLCEAFVRYKTGAIEESVNGRFETVRWELFEEQVNGGLAERCEAIVGGTAYNGGLNDGARINAGLEVVDVLSGFYGVSVPLMVDGAESVTRLRRTVGQVIRLAVSENDPVLRVEMEE